MLSKRFNVVTLVAATSLFSALSLLVYSKIIINKQKNQNESEKVSDNFDSSCETVVHRLDGYELIKPILYNAQTCESSRLNNLEIKINEVIKKFQNEGVLDHASIFFKIINTREFININPEQKYHPASLIKLPILITYLKMEENFTGILNKELVFHLPKNGLPSQTYNSKQIVPEKKYTVRELLKYMIAYSDNNATYLLNNNVDLVAFKKMFSDLELVVPDVQDMNFQITSKDYSVFLNVIYNAGYLNIKNSEYVAELLKECDFVDGIQKGLPNDIRLIHKFGEWGSDTNIQLHQLSESGIVYLGDSPYLLTIMTQGNDVKKLPEVIATISNLVYYYQKENNKSST